MIGGSLENEEFRSLIFSRQSPLSQSSFSTFIRTRSSFLSSSFFISILLSSIFLLKPEHIGLSEKRWIFKSLPELTFVFLFLAWLLWDKSLKFVFFELVLSPADIIIHVVVISLIKLLNNFLEAFYESVLLLSRQTLNREKVHRDICNVSLVKYNICK